MGDLGLGSVLLVVGIGVVIIAVVGYVLAYLAFLRKAGPNEVIVVSGRGRVKFITGGADMVVPLFHTWNRLSLEVMTLDVTTPEVYTSQGVPILVDGVAQIKIRKDEVSLHAAAERFLGKTPNDIAKIALETVQGHLRAILGTLSVEDIYKNRDQFAQKVQEISAGDLANMGLGIDSFTIRDIRDKHGYLDALGKPRIAEVEDDGGHCRGRGAMEASIAQADAERETRERQAQAQRLAQEAEAKRDAAVAEANADARAQAGGRRDGAPRRRNRQVPVAAQAIAEQQTLANRKKAEAEMAYELQHKTMEIPVQEQEILRRRRSSTRHQAPSRRQAVRDRDAGRRQPQADRSRGRGRAARACPRWPTAITRGASPPPRSCARRARRRPMAEKARGPGRGADQAEAARRRGLAEALAMEKKAEAWRKYNEAAVLQILAPLLPEIARAIAEPLAKIDRITMVNTGGNGDGGISRITGEVAKVIAQVPPCVESLTGLKLEELMQRLQPTGSPAATAPATAADSGAEAAPALAVPPPTDVTSPKSSRAKNS